MSNLTDLLATADRVAVRELLIAAYAAWENHYSGGYLYTDDPDAIALFAEARERYRTWREERVAQVNISLAKLPLRSAFTDRVRGLLPDVTDDELLLLEATHGLDVNDATAQDWITTYRTKQAE